MRRYALEGLHVLDFSWVGVGPITTKYLADNGADVIRVEPPAGDGYRNYPLSFLAVNQRKRGMALALGAPVSNEIVHIVDMYPTLARVGGAEVPKDRAIDGVDQTDLLLGSSTMGHRESLLTFIGADLVAARWKQWRIYFTDVHPTGIGPQREPGIFSANAPMAGYPKVYNIEMDAHEDLNVKKRHAEGKYDHAVLSHSGSTVPV